MVGARANVDNTGVPVTQKFLDGNQYTTNGIKRYQRIFGNDFVSTGGKDTTQKLFDLLELKSGEKVLDVGCGTGVADILMSELFDVHVHGIDLSTNMVKMANDNVKQCDPELQKRLTFDIVDCMTHDFKPQSFDAIFTKDAMIHIKDKLFLFSKFYKWLKPGGRLLITDYAVGRETPSTPEFALYVKQRGYNLCTVDKYGDFVRNAGFDNDKVTAIDNCDTFMSILAAELARFQAQKEDFIQEFCLKDYKDLEKGWQDKIKYCADKDMTWAIMFARK